MVYSLAMVTYEVERECPVCGTVYEAAVIHCRECDVQTVVVCDLAEIDVPARLLKKVPFKKKKART